MTKPITPAEAFLAMLAAIEDTDRPMGETFFEEIQKLQGVSSPMPGTFDSAGGEDEPG